MLVVLVVEVVGAVAVAVAVVVAAVVVVEYLYLKRIIVETPQPGLVAPVLRFPLLSREQQ
ncbi:MAG: hypothetical protein QGH82_02055 [Candidatus Woesearchaeota archaeon]|nr:hypothetical protein [Candidatus Woesearchaeota archaeon]